MASKIGVVLGVIAIVLAIAAIAGPWWTVDSHASLGGLSATGHSEYNLFGTVNSEASNTTSRSNTTTYAALPQVGSVFSLATALTVVGLILGFGMVVLGVLTHSRQSFRRLAVIAGVLAFVVLLVAALYVMSALPGAVNQDTTGRPFATTYSGFWGTQSSSMSFFGITISGTVTWGAGWAWYLALAAAIVFLIGSLAIAVTRQPAMAPISQPAQ